MAQMTLRDYLQETEDAIDAGRIDDALSHCQTVLAQYPEALEAQRLLGEVYLRQGQLTEAQQAFDWILTNDPENVIAYCNRALISERQSDYDTALDCYQQAYELSRGHSKIRQEFNQLSTKAGQQSFMYSRAGLARLYMRGDLLTQAIQEWEIVLSGSPDRLDARIGLMEAYWREGGYEETEQWANQILQNVPGCVKALLLLAHVNATKNIQQAQELVLRARSLDPDLLMAQELFSDMMASQPGDAFLSLLKKPPAGIDLTPDAPVVAPLSIPESNVSSPVSALNVSTSPDAFASWPGMDSWNASADFIKPLQEAQAKQNPSTLPIWEDKTVQMPDPWSILEKSQGSQPKSDISDLAAQLSGESTLINPWSALDQSLASSPEVQPAPQAPDQEETQQEVWLPASMEPVKEDIPISQKLPEGDTLSWDDIAKISSHGFDSLETWGASSNSGAGSDQNFDSLETWGASSNPETGSGSNWSSLPTEGESSAPPAWLSMLTQGERRQLGGEAELVEEAPQASAGPSIFEELAPAQEKSVVQPAPAPKIEPPVARKEEPKPVAPQPAEQEDEGFFFGPEWLKSLGAASIEEGFAEKSASPFEQEEAVISAPVPEVQAKEEPRIVQEEQPALEAFEQPYESYEPYEPSVGTYDFIEQLGQASTKPVAAEEPVAPMPLFEEPEQAAFELPPEYMPFDTSFLSSMQESKEANQIPTYDIWSSQPSYVDDKEEQNLLTTLEELEHDLRSQGFVPLEPNSLSSLAKSQDAPPMTPTPGFDTSTPQEHFSGGGLSSALAELGNFAQSTSSQISPIPEEPPAPVQPALPPAASVAQPSWLESLSALPTASAPQRAQLDVSVYGEVPTTPGAQVAPVQPVIPIQPIVPAQPVIENTPRPAPVQRPAPSPVFNPTPAPFPAVRISREPAKDLSTRSDALLDLDSELETTMKRPAVRLQPMQRAGGQREQLSANRTRASERTSFEGGQRSSANMSSQERLVKGYQHQLVGDYDEAMQEYRVIIRGAPELLGEVISNVRALLKLAPKYSAGYRVLGDAYMRQGEYLQAMEAYNKALTMTKRAKS